MRSEALAGRRAGRWRGVPSLRDRVRCGCLTASGLSRPPVPQTTRRLWCAHVAGLGLRPRSSPSTLAGPVGAGGRRGCSAAKGRCRAVRRPVVRRAWMASASGTGPMRPPRRSSAERRDRRRRSPGALGGPAGRWCMARRMVSALARFPGPRSWAAWLAVPGSASGASRVAPRGSAGRSVASTNLAHLSRSIGDRSGLPSPPCGLPLRDGGEGQSAQAPACRAFSRTRRTRLAGLLSRRMGLRGWCSLGSPPPWLAPARSQWVPPPIWGLAVRAVWPPLVGLPPCLWSDHGGA
jgi:hypothetical protein